MFSKRLSHFLVLAALVIPAPSLCQTASAPCTQGVPSTFYNGHGFHIVYPTALKQTEMPDGEGIKLIGDEISGIIVEPADSTDLAASNEKMRQQLTADGWTLTADPKAHNPIEGTATVKPGDERYVRVLWVLGGDQLWYILGYGKRADAQDVATVVYKLYQNMLFDPPAMATSALGASETPKPADPQPVPRPKAKSPSPKTVAAPQSSPAITYCPECTKLMFTFMSNMTRSGSSW